MAHARGSSRRVAGRSCSSSAASSCSSRPPSAAATSASRRRVTRCAVPRASCPPTGSASWSRSLLLAILGPGSRRRSRSSAHVASSRPRPLLQTARRRRGVDLATSRSASAIVASGLDALGRDRSSTSSSPFVAGAYYRRPFVGLAIAARRCWSPGALIALDLGESALARDRRQRRDRGRAFDDYYASQLPSWGLRSAAGMTGAWALRPPARPVRAPGAARPPGARGRSPLATVRHRDRGRLRRAQSAVDDPNPFLGAVRAPVAGGVARLCRSPSATVMVASALVARSGCSRRSPTAPLRSFADISYARLPDPPRSDLGGRQRALACPRRRTTARSRRCSPGRRSSSRPRSLYAYLSAASSSGRCGAGRAGTAARRPPVGAAASAGREPSPAVSIVIPTYNRREWLAGALDSVLEQDYANLEAAGRRRRLERRHRGAPAPLLAALARRSASAS